LLGGTNEIRASAESNGVNNSRQDLEGMFFQLQPPSGGNPASEVTTRFSIDSYNRWEYDEASEKYLRLQDNVYANDQEEEYAPLFRDGSRSQRIMYWLMAPHCTSAARHQKLWKLIQWKRYRLCFPGWAGV
jgi:hypothetical protein